VDRDRLTPSPSEACSWAAGDEELDGDRPDAAGDACDERGLTGLRGDRVRALGDARLGDRDPRRSGAGVHGRVHRRDDKLELEPATTEHRGVLAVLTYLRNSG
jgi:hypothetical protein